MDRYDADIIGTQEGLAGALGDIRSHFPEYGFVGGGRMGGAEDEHNAIMYRASRFKLLDHGNFWLSDTPEVPGSRSWGNRVPRMATWARFLDKETDSTFHHTNTHFDHEMPGARRRAAELVSARLPREAGGAYLVTGDLNAFSWTRALKHLIAPDGGGLRDSAALATKAAPKRFAPTFHKWTGLGLYRIDYVLTSGAFGVNEVTTVRDRVDGRYPSDHFPFFADVELAPRDDEGFDPEPQFVRRAPVPHSVAA